MRRVVSAALLSLACLAVACSEGSAPPEAPVGTSASALDADRTTEVLRQQVRAAQDGATLGVDVLYEPDVDSDEALRIARAAGAVPRDQALRYGGVLRAEATADAIASLARTEGVVVVAHVPPPDVALLEERDNGTLNATSRDTSNVEDVAPGGVLGTDLTGADVILGIVDEGPIRASHLDFGGRAAYLDPDGTLSAHATHVTGTAIGSGAGRAEGRGFAPGARALAWTFHGRDTIDFVREVAFRFTASNHSYGPDLGWDADGVWQGDTDFGKYTLDARRIDQAIRELDIIWVKAAGNDAGDGADLATERNPVDCSTGFDCISGPGNAKNLLTIGAVNDLTADPAAPGSALVASFSSRGPADDGRVKPDLVANGVGVLSPTQTGDSAYGRFSGTSMAAPAVTGAIALVAELYRTTLGRDPDMAELRGLLVHTALWNDEDGRPDPRLGWGVLDVAAAVRLVQRHADAPRILHGLYAGDPLSFTVTPVEGETVSLTLSWLDPAGNVNTGGADDRTPALVHDLDMSAEQAGGSHFPWRLDPDAPGDPAVADGPNRVDNIERIVIPAAQVGSTPVTVTVGHHGTLRDGAQPFVLVSSHPVHAETEPALIGAWKVVRRRAQNDEAPTVQPLPLALTAGASADCAVEIVDAPFWLSLAGTDCALPSDVPTVRIDPRGLTPALHYATVRVTNLTTPDAPPLYVSYVLDVRSIDVPVAFAGDDRRVPEGSRVVLGGAGSDPVGDPVALTWEQVAGPTVELSATDTASPRFVAPNVGADTTLRFSLVASNGSLESAPDAVDVVVFPTDGPGEPDDNRCATAPVVTLPYLETGALAPLHDVDFVRFAVAAGDVVHASTVPSGAVTDTTVGLLSTDGDVLGFDTDGGFSVYSDLTVTVGEAGEVCVAVTGRGDSVFDGARAESAGPYALFVRLDGPNAPPIADAGESRTVAGATRVELDGTASHDPDGAFLRYAWSQTAGPEVALSALDVPRPRFFAPAGLAEPAELVFGLEVRDADGAVASDTVTITVDPAAATVPIADAGGPRTLPEGSFATLRGRGLGVADEALTFLWTQASGSPLALVGADTDTLRFLTPGVDEPTEFAFDLVVTGAEASAPDRAVVTVVPTAGTVEPADNNCDTAVRFGRSPRIELAMDVVRELTPRHDIDASRFEVLDGSTWVFETRSVGVDLDTTIGVFRSSDAGWELVASDDDGGDVGFSRIEGTSDADGTLCVVVSHAPDRTFDGADGGGEGPYDLRAHVTPPPGSNHPPVADAGADQDVDPGAVVTLDGSASIDPDGDRLDYRWRLVTSPVSVAIDDADEAVARVTVPNDLATSADLTFELTVSDGGLDHSDTVRIGVPANHAPTIEPIARVEADLGDEVSFAVSASDSDGDAVAVTAADLPDGAEFDTETATFTWTTDATGLFTPRFVARDPYGAASEATVTIAVVDRSLENHAPVVSPIDDVVVATDDVPVELTLEVDAIDRDGDPLEYYWQLSDRTLLGVTRTVDASFGFGTHTVECFVSDGRVTTRVAFRVEVRPATRLPVADAGRDQVLRAIGADDAVPVLVLDGRASDDPESRGPLTWQWTQTDGPDVELFGASTALPTFAQPVGEGALRFGLVVSVEAAGETVESVPAEVVVNLVDGHANARPGAFVEGPDVAETGDTIELDASASEDPDGDTLDYLWSFERGAGALSSGATARVTATLDAPDAGEWEFALLTWDGFSYSRLVRHTVALVGVTENGPPDARALLVGSPRPGNRVHLDANGSTDPDGDDLAFAWEQTAGPFQTLDRSDAPVVELTLAGEPGDLLEFEVTVDDGVAAATAVVRFVLLGSVDTDAGLDGGLGDASNDADAGGRSGSRSGGGGCASVPVGAPRGAPLAWGLALGAGAVLLARRRR